MSTTTYSRLVWCMVGDEPVLQLDSTSLNVGDVLKVRDSGSDYLVKVGEAVREGFEITYDTEVIDGLAVHGSPPLSTSLVLSEGMGCARTTYTD